MGRAHLGGGAGAGVAVVVGGEDHDGGGEADDGDHRDGEQRAQLRSDAASFFFDVIGAILIVLGIPIMVSALGIGG